MGLSGLLREGIKEYNSKACAGRWGGEEFMVLMPYPLDYTIESAEHIREDFESVNFENGVGHRTISIGVTAMLPDEDSDALCIRVDKALYQAKETGKNRVVVL